MQGLGADTMVHESTHLLLDLAVDSTLARVPAWLNEGLAMQFESDSRARERLVERSARLNSLLRLRNMGSVPGRPREVGMFYAQAWSVVDYMVDTHGAERMSALLTAINDGQKIEDAVPTAYGLTLEQLEARWKAQVLGETTVAARPDPGTIGTALHNILGRRRRIFVGGVVQMNLGQNKTRFVQALDRAVTRPDVDPVGLPIDQLQVHIRHAHRIDASTGLGVDNHDSSPSIRTVYAFAVRRQEASDARRPPHFLTALHVDPKHSANVRHRIDGIADRNRWMADVRSRGKLPFNISTGGMYCVNVTVDGCKE